MVDPDKGEIFYAGPQIPNYAGTQFKKEIEESFNIPCEIENDVNCAGLAEAVSGSGKGASITLCLTIGTGIGGCLIIDGQVFHGFSNSACEVGYLHMQDGASRDLASTTALVKYVADAQERSGTVERSQNFKEATEGNNSVWRGLTVWWITLQGSRKYLLCCNPEVVILGGGIMGQEAILKPKFVRL